MKTISSLLLLAVAILIPGFSSFAQAPAPKEALLDTVTELHKKGFNTFVAAVAKTDFVTKLSAGEYTVIAPTDAAFRDLPKTELDALLADKEKLTAVLSNHIVEGKVATADLKSGNVKTLGGTTVLAKSVDGKLKIGAATIVRSEVASANGVIYGVDRILQP